MSQIKMFKLTADRFEHKAGTVVYRATGHDYGLARDDTIATGINHVSMTLKADGDYPFFTVPEADLAVHVPAAKPAVEVFL